MRSIFLCLVDDGQAHGKKKIGEEFVQADWVVSQLD